MPKAIAYFIRTAVILILGSKLLNIFYPLSEPVKEIINIAMFVLIGGFFLLVSWFWEKNLVKYLIATCGTYLIVMNFLPDYDALPLIGIGCMVVPFLIIAFKKEEPVAM